MNISENNNNLLDEMEISLDEILDEAECNFLSKEQKVRVKLAMLTAIRQALELASSKAISAWTDGSVILCSNAGCANRNDPSGDIYDFIDKSVLKTMNKLK